MSSARPSTPSKDSQAQASPSSSAGWVLLVLGLAGVAYFPYEIMTDRGGYTIFGPVERTLGDNLRSMGPMALLSLHFVIMGIGVTYRRPWATRTLLLLGCMIVMLLWMALIALDDLAVALG